MYGLFLETGLPQLINGSLTPEYPKLMSSDSSSSNSIDYLVLDAMRVNQRFSASVEQTSMDQPYVWNG